MYQIATKEQLGDSLSKTLRFQQFAVSHLFLHGKTRRRKNKNKENGISVLLKYIVTECEVILV